MDGIQQIILIGVSASVFIVMFKLAMGFVPVPGLRDIAGML